MAFEQIVDRIYLSAADAELWPETLDLICRSVDAALGVILTRRSDAWTGWRHNYPGPEDSIDDYIVNHSHKSRTTPFLLQTKRAGFVGSDEAFVSDEDYRSDAMIRDWGAAHGMFHAAATAIQVPSDDLIVVQIQRKAGEPAFDAGQRARLDMFRPHLARAGLLAVRWRMEKLQAATLALAQIGLPAAVIAPDGKTLAANKLLETPIPGLVWRAGDRLALVDGAANLLLDRAIASLRRPAENAVRSIAIRHQDRPIGVMHVIPAAGWARDVFAGGYGLMVFTPLATQPNPLSAELLQGLFDLTASESRVAAAIADGVSLQEIANGNAVSYETVRAQAKAVYAKTGVSRQNELTSLLARIPRLRNPPTDR